MKLILSLCFTFLLFFQINAQVVINEFMASNDTLTMITDEEGAYEDWIELHNTSNQAFDLSGYHLSDKANNLDKFAFADGQMIAANGYLIIWCDEDSSDGPLHTNFRLSSAGENIFFTGPDTLDVIQTVSFGPQETNISYARIPNGTGDFMFRAPTFNSNNDGVATKHLPLNTIANIYPNPTSDALFVEQLLHNEQLQALFILDAMGRQTYAQFNFDQQFSIDLSNYQVGIYFVEIQTEKNNYIQKIQVH